MNERIKLLAEQARKEYLKLPTGYRPDQVGMCRELMEKFAELIIQECARVAVATPCPITDEISKQSQGHTWDIACVEAARAIKQHFRVNE